MPPESLFRPEVLENRSHLPFGPIRLARNYSSLVIASISLTLTVAVVVFLFVADFTRKTTVRGHLVPTHGLAVVVSPIRGTLKTILVQEGDHVERGQTLGMVVTEQQTRSGDALKEVESLIEEQQAGVNDELYAQEKLTARQRAGLLVRIKVLRSELTNAESELSTAVERSLIADKTLHQLRQLAGKGHVSSMQLHAQEEQTLALRSLVQQTKRLTLQIEREISELDQQLDELPSRLETQRAASQRSIAELAQEAAENRVTVERLLKAPISGLGV